MCNFGAGGFSEPEMVKCRPVVVLSPRRYNAQTALVVPLSTSEPEEVLPFHHRMDPRSMPRKFRGEPNWVKGNMVTHVSLHRLDRPSYRRSTDRLRIYDAPLVLAADWAQIVRCVQNAFAFGLPEKAEAPPGIPGGASE
jgi:uncharacterized protein YifN (PemK superfamily)